MVHISERELQLPKQEIGRLIQIAAEIPGILSLGPGEPDFPLPSPLVKELQELAAQPKINRYAPPQGFADLREAIARKLKKENKIKNADPESIVVTCGSQEALLLAAAALLCAGEQTLIPNPSFMGYYPTIELLDAAPVFFELKPEQGFEPDPEAIEKAILPGKTQAIILNSPANPTGNVISKAVWEEIADIAIEHDLWIFSDEAYEKFVYDGAKHFSPASLNGLSEHVLTFQSFSKTFAMCGFRLGYVLAPNPELAEAITKEHIYSAICAPTIAQRLGLAALKLKKTYIDAMIREFAKRRKVILARLAQLGLETPKPYGAFYTFSRIDKFGYSSKEFCHALLKRAKVAVVPGSDFGTAGEGWIRCSYAASLDVIDKAMDALEQFLKTFKPKAARPRHSC